MAAEIISFRLERHKRGCEFCKYPINRFRSLGALTYVIKFASDLV